MVFASWPVFHGTPQADGRSRDAGPSSPSVKWRFDEKLYMYHSPVTGDDGTIYVLKGTGDANQWSHTIYAVSREGRKKWAYTFPRSALSTLAVYKNSAVYAVATRAVDEKVDYPNEGGKSETFLLSLDAATGILKRQYLLSRHFTDPWIAHVTVASDGAVYAGVKDSLYAFNAAGEKLWSYDYAGPDPLNQHSQSGTGPVISPDEKTVYYFRRFGGGLYAHDAKTGKKKWNVLSGNSYSDFSSPTVGPDGTIYMPVSGAYTLYAYTPDGREKWKIKLKGTAASSNPAVGIDGTIYLDAANTASDDGGTIYALDPGDGKIKWGFDLPKGYMVSAMAVDSRGYIYYTHGDGYIYCLNQNGKLLWKFLAWKKVEDKHPNITDRVFMSGPAIDKGLLYVITGSTDAFGLLTAVGDK